MIKKKIKIPIYLGYLVIIVTKKLKTVAKKYNVVEPDDMFFEFEAFVFRLSKKGKSVKYYCVLRPDASVGAVAHEASHVVNHIFKDNRITVDMINNDEVYCYLLEWIVNKIYKTIKK